MSWGVLQQKDRPGCLHCLGPLNTFLYVIEHIDQDFVGLVREELEILCGPTVKARGRLSISLALGFEFLWGDITNMEFIGLDNVATILIDKVLASLSGSRELLSVIQSQA